ncbi:family 16 glycosylhydrolase [Candidatus Bathyarchaeota archaeon]|nr:family 16 glycosylhydrolase [Candidatus Bathyarchaeota archaeon]
MGDPKKTNATKQEWLGGKPDIVQTNFFSRGVNELALGNGVTHGLTFPATSGTHTYTIDWTPEGISFLIDGAEVHHAAVGDPAKWPQTPMQIKLGTWAGGHPDNDPGTIEWAGGATDFKAAPFTGWYKSIKVVDYCGGKDGAEEYVWTDGSGTQESIEVVGGKGDGKFKEEGGNDKKDGETSSGKPSKTGEASKSGADDAEKTDDADASEEGEGKEGAASLMGFSPALAAVVGLGYLLLA